jgi:hypothetical protein
MEFFIKLQNRNEKLTQKYGTYKMSTIISPSRSKFHITMALLTFRNGYCYGDIIPVYSGINAGCPGTLRRLQDKHMASMQSCFTTTLSNLIFSMRW